uniref:Uncharacterized protein n=1 Tax=Bactrocera dorsalis TaxID=27457 RepID=A0A034WUX7_BACDO
MSGNAAASKLIIDVTSTPTRAIKYKKIIEAQKPEIKKYTPAEALQIFVEENSENYYTNQTRVIFLVIRLLEEQKKAVIQNKIQYELQRDVLKLCSKIYSTTLL